MRNPRTALVLVFILVVPLLVQAAINRGIIEGTVTDSQGAALPDATVIIKNLDTDVENKLTTNSVGAFLATDLVPGRYSIAVSAKGFSPVTVADVTVTAGVTTTQDVSMKVGSISQQVEVTAAPPLVDTSSSNFTNTLETQAIQNVPLPGRDIQALVQLIPGVTQSAGPSGALFGFNSQFGGFPDPLHLIGSGISVNGSQGGANAWYLDGSLNAALGPENVVVNPSPDAVAEFNVVDNGLAAEYGRTSGAIVNVVLKSGTNNYHGDLYEYNRNSYFNATNPFDRRDASGHAFLEPHVNFNNFGGTFGGPLRRNKTFFFVSYDFSILHESKPVILSVPTAAERGGDFSADPTLHVCDATHTNCLYDPSSTIGPCAKGQSPPGCTTNGTYQRTPLATGLVISQTMQDSLAAFYASSFPDPNFVDPLRSDCVSGGVAYCNNFIGPVVSAQHDHNVSLKIDHRISDKHQLFGEWLYNPYHYANLRYPWNGATAQTQTGIAAAQPYDTRNQIFTLGLTSSFTPNFINEARGMFSRQAQIGYANPDSVTQTSQVEQKVQGLNYYLFPPFQVVPGIGIGGGGSFPGIGFGPQQWQNAIQGVQAATLLDNVTRVIDKHVLKGGLMFRRDYNWNLAAWGYGLGFSGNLTNSGSSAPAGGSGLAQFLLGAVDQGSGSGTYHAPWQINNYWGFYFQDDFRVTPHLTLNYGLRYDIFPWFFERFNDIANFNPTGMNPQVPAPGRLDYFGTSRHPDRNVFPSHKNDFGPRFAFSWSPFADNKTVIRGGAGVIYSNGISAAFGDQNGAISGPAFANYIAYSGDFTGQRPAFFMSQGAPNLNLPALDFAKSSDDQFLGTTIGAFERGSKDPYVEQWSLYVERQLPSNMMVSVGYVGTHGLHLYGDEFRNIDHIPTATRLALRTAINNPIAGPAWLSSVYGCPIDTNGNSQCAANLVDRPWPQYTGVTPNTSPDGFNRYHSFQTKVEKRYSQGLDFIGVYTWQKNIQSPNTGSIIGNTATPSTLGRPVGRASLVAGAISGGVANYAGGSAPEDLDNRDLYVALAPDDIPNILNLQINYELPFGHGKPFLSGNDKLFGGWRFTQNWNFQSGVPLEITAPCNSISCLPNLIGDPSKGRSSSRGQQEAQWFNPSAFEAAFGSDPTVLTQIYTGALCGTGNPPLTPPNCLDPNADVLWRFGNAGLRPPGARAPGFWNVDMSLAKDLHFSEAKYMQFRWDLYNALNHQNLGLPNTRWCLQPVNGNLDAVHQFGCSFGQITNIQTDARNMQFGLKFVF